MEDETEASTSEELYRHSDVDFSAIYIAIGKFAVEFEKVSTFLRHGYGSLLQIAGLQRWELGANLLNIPQLGPALLAQAFCAGVHQLSDNEALKTRASKVVTGCQKLAEDRNNVLHGEWMVGDEVVFYTDSPTSPEPGGIKRKATKAGERVDELPKLAEIDALIVTSKALREEVKDIYIAIVMADMQERFPQEGQA